MAIERRRLLQALGAAGLAAAAHPLLALAAHGPADPPRYLSARRRAGRYEAVLLDARGRDLRVLPLPDRGHSFAIDAARQRAVVFGRQPGFFAAAFGLDDTAPPQLLPLATGRHYYGHGCFSADGRRLYATENDFESGRGVLGVYEHDAAQGWQRRAELDTHGIGPHEVVPMPDGRTLCVANGGILTHPDYGKTELNLDSMAPSLAYLDAADGRLLEQVGLAPALHRLSIRHLALDGSGAVWFGCQYFGSDPQRPPLLGRHRRGQAPQLFAGDAEVLRAMQHYVGSVAVDVEAGIVAASSPIGSVIAYWDVHEGRCLGSTPLADGCGVAARADGGFLLSSGHGALVAVRSASAGDSLLPASGDIGWDNHLRRI